MLDVLRFVGDVHGEFGIYNTLARKARYSLQIGDMGLSYKKLRRMDLDWTTTKFFGGNHDCYDRDSPEYIHHQPGALHDFGLHVVPGRPPIFFVRGGWSIDHDWRQVQAAMGGLTTWWADEELSDAVLASVVEAYVAANPEIVATHECPLDIVKHVTDPKFTVQFGYPSGTIPTRTNVALQAMWDAHRPKLWVFGHYHRRWEGVIDGTRFVCLDMIRSRNNANAYLDLPLGQPLSD